MAAELLNNGLIDEVWVVPCKTPDDEKNYINHRLRMIELSVDEFFKGTGFKVKIDETEIISNESLSSFSLMKKFISEFPQYRFSFILGSDILPSIRFWNEGNEFADNIHIFVFERPGYPILKEQLPIHNTPMESISLSSSSAEVRERIHFVKSLYQEENLTKEKLYELLKDKSSKVSEFSHSMIGDFNIEDRIKKMKKHLGVYGILTNSVIEYIRENHLY